MQLSVTEKEWIHSVLTRNLSLLVESYAAFTIPSLTLQQFLAFKLSYIQEHEKLQILRHFHSAQLF
jgi:hypothetical protein